MQSFNKWFWNQFVPVIEEEQKIYDKTKEEKKPRKRKQKYVNRKTRFKMRTQR